MSVFHEFMTAIRDPGVAPPATIKHPLTGHASDGWARFDIYRNNYAQGLHEALCDGFPMVLALLGRQRFHLLSVAYLEAMPPSSPLMLQLGATLPAFMDQFEALSSLPYAGDVARLDLALREVFHARDHVPVALGAMQDDAALAEKKISLAPCARLFASQWAPYELWRYLADDGPPPDFDAPHSASALVFRYAGELHVMGLSAPQTRFICRLVSGDTLAAAAECDGLAPAALQQVMAEILRAQLIEQITI